MPEVAVLIARGDRGDVDRAGLKVANAHEAVGSDCTGYVRLREDEDRAPHFCRHATELAGLPQNQRGKDP